MSRQILDRFAATISQHPLGLVLHAPESWAQPTQCFQNVLQKVSRDGGDAIFGWAFFERTSPEFGEYWIAQHHAVWHREGSTAAVDITPFHDDPRHRPMCPVQGSIAFLWDEAAKPKAIGHALAPLPSRFFPATDHPRLAAYLETLKRKEQADCQKLYEGALTAHLTAQGGRPT